MVISLAGEWDIYREDELRRRLEPAYREGSVVFDLTTAKYVTSTLIGALFLVYKHRDRDGLSPASIAVKSAFVRRLLSVTDVDDYFEIYDSVEEAIYHSRRIAG